jgi:glycosyltransferase involved in cell wall biosynthesis
MAKLFSVIIPTLNERKYLPHLLECLSKQTYRNFEVIIVDGASDDHTIELAKTFKKMLPREIFCSVRKRNVAYQRNIGAKRAKGEYLVFFDADMQIPSNFLQGVMEKIVRSHPQLFTTYLISPDRDMKKIAITSLANIGKELISLVGKPTAGGYNIIVTKKLFEKVKGFDASVVHGEDYDFIHRCYNRGVLLRIYRNPQMIFSFRRYEKEGYLSTLEREAAASLHVLFLGSIHEQFFDYPMGGHVYDKKNKE